MASLSCKISPRTSTVIFFDKSPLATAIVTSAMLRTCAVRFDAIELTLSVRSFHTPVTPPTCAWPPSLPSVPTSRATRVTSEVNTLSCLIMVLTISAERRNSPFSGRPSTSSCTVCRQVALRHRGDGARHFRGRPKQIVDQRIDGCFHLAPGAVGQAEAHALAGAAFAADDLADAFELPRHALVGAGDFVEGVGDLADETDAVAGHAHGEVADPHGLQGVQKFRQAAGIDVGAGIAIDLGLADLGADLGNGRGGTVGDRGASNVFSGLHEFSPKPGADQTRHAVKRMRHRRRTGLTSPRRHHHWPTWNPPHDRASTFHAWTPNAVRCGRFRGKIGLV